ncbi:MAG: hypothetical protein HGB11_08775 [Chlorobiales bacterium]|nr:hypothetical protein [Chlorobiales bacterium]
MGARKRKAVKPKIFLEDINEQKYLFLVERMKFARGETSYDAVHEKAESLLEAIETRARQVFADGKRRRLKVCAAELIAMPFIHLAKIP